MASNGVVSEDAQEKLTDREKNPAELSEAEILALLKESGEKDGIVPAGDTESDADDTSLSGLSDLGNEQVGEVEGIFGALDDSSPPRPTLSSSRSVLSFSDFKFVSTDLSKPVELRLVEGKGAGSERPETVIEVFRSTVERFPQRHALYVKRVGLWKKWTYRKYYEDCHAMARMFVKLGLEPSNGVCIIGFNSPEWLITYMAAVMAGGVPVGVYINLSAEACGFIAEDCKANIIVVDNEQQLNKILYIKNELPHLKAIIQYIGTPPTGEAVYEWSRVQALGYEEPPDRVDHRMIDIKANKCCSLIYTSGTTGTPKGVMLSHDNFTWSARQLQRVMQSRLPQEHVVSYLPLAHVAAQILDIYVSLFTGGTTWFAQPDALKGSLIQTVREVRPTIFLGVPRVWEKLAIGMQTYGSSLSSSKKRLSKWALGIGLKGNLSKQDGGKTPLGWTLARLLVFKKISKRLGLDRCHHHLTGAAPISEDTLSYFLSLNICLHQLYGMSESSGPATVTTEHSLRSRSNGYAMEGTEMRISHPDETGVGEVVIRGRNVFMGYLNNFEKTCQIFTSDGFLRSGDYGQLDKDGYLYITGRMKELIVLANGDKVAPVPLEQMIKAEIPIISNAIIVGDKRTYLVCLLTLKVEFEEGTSLPSNRLTEEALMECKTVGSSAKTVDDIIDEEGDKIILKMIKRGIDHVNKKATSKSQKIMRWTVLDKDLSVAGQELTPTLKLKRPTIVDKYSEHIDFLY